MGALHEESTIFTTFLKARMTCTSHTSGGNGLVYHYNDLYDTYYVPEEAKVYALFRSPQ
jgi:hypothetical protein